MKVTNNSRVRPNVIIAGTVKAGTTSLFSYLSIHPAVSTSKIKETCFFLPIRYGKRLQLLSEYESYFPENCQSEYIIESTPGYLDGGEVLAKKLKQVLGDLKIIIVLRDPTDRLISFFRYQKAQLNLPKDMSFSNYVSACQNMPFDKRKLQENDAYWGVDGGKYMNYLPGWINVFGIENINIVFFDDLVVDPKTTMINISNWMGINPQPFCDYVYEVENKTVLYRYAWPHKIAISFNRLFEPVLRSAPSIKRLIRSTYYLFNSGNDAEVISSEIKTKVDGVYSEDNRSLEKFLNDNNYTALPSWLKRQ